MSVLGLWTGQQSLPVPQKVPMLRHLLPLPFRLFSYIHLSVPRLSLSRPIATKALTKALEYSPCVS